MRVCQIVTLVALIGSTSAFTSAPRAFGISTTCLPMADVEAETETQVESPTSGLSMRVVHRMMKNASAASFDEVVKTIEPFLVNDAGTTMLAKTMSRLSAQAKLFGKTLPDGYAVGAAAAAKRIAKQNAFIAKKEEARVAAEAQAIADAEAAVAGTCSKTHEQNVVLL